MRCSAILASAMAASVYAAPTWPSLNLDAAKPGNIDLVSDYFNMLASKVQAGRQMSFAPVCDLSKAVMPAAPVPLSAPAQGLTLKHVAIGRGTQNYTCDTTNATAVPAAAGAVATLFNASCIASIYPDLTNMLPKMSLQFKLGPDELHRMGPSNLAISGHHFFTNLVTPFFNLDTESSKIGQCGTQKNSSTPAPTDAPKGLNGENAVPWLKLTTRDGSTGNLQEVYRLETAGGSAPATCQGMPATFEVQYSAQYWFWSTPSSP